MIRITAQLQRLVNKRLAFSFFVFAIFYFLLASPLGGFAIPVSAQTENSYSNTNPDVPKNLHTWTQNVMIEVMSAMTCQLAGIDPTNPNQACLGVDQSTGKIGFVEKGGGAIGVMGNLIAVTFTPPLHTGDYFNYLAQNFGIAKPAYAQGTGFQGLSPLMPIWSAFRNIVYLLFVLVFVLIGIAIMLRVKIDPRTVMTIENQIPKIIIGLILVTFSFAIVGFLIDIMWVLIYLVFNVFNEIITDTASLANTQKNFSGNNVLGVFNPLVHFVDIVTYSAGGVKDVVINLFSVPPDYRITQSYQPNWWDWFKFWEWVNIGSIVTNAFALIFGGIAGVLALLIISIAVLWALFRLWFTLIMAYVFILLDVVFAPFWIVAGLLPGSPISFSGWLRDLGANLIAFPATIVMFLLGKALMDAFKNPGPNVFFPPLIGNPGGASGDISGFGAFIGLGFILMTPNVVSMMKTAFKAPRINLAPIAQAIGVGAAVPTGTGKTLGGVILASKYYGLSGILSQLFTGTPYFAKRKRLDEE